MALRKVQDEPIPFAALREKQVLGCAADVTREQAFLRVTMQLSGPCVVLGVLLCCVTAHAVVVVGGSRIAPFSFMLESKLNYLVG